MRHDDGRLEVGPRHDRNLPSYHMDQGDSNDCGPHVVATVINFWHGEERLRGAEVARHMNRPRVGGGFPPVVIRRVPSWATFPWGIVDVLRQHGIEARWQWRAREEHLFRALEEDRIAMPIYGEPFRRRGWRWTGWSHVAIVSGWDPATETYWFVDSSRQVAPTSRPRDEFLRLWGNMGRLLIETR